MLETWPGLRYEELVVVNSEHYVPLQDLAHQREGKTTSITLGEGSNQIIIGIESLLGPIKEKSDEIQESTTTGDHNMIGEKWANQDTEPNVSEEVDSRSRWLFPESQNGDLDRPKKSRRLSFSERNLDGQKLDNALVDNTTRLTIDVLYNNVVGATSKEAGLVIENCCVTFFL